MQGKLYATDLFPIGQIDHRINSSLAEHMGRSIYGGIYDPDSPLADDAGLRKDVMAAVKELNVPLVRYPGGNFVSSYHWEDGIGPRDQRQQKVDLAWKSVESNQFGLDDFMDWTTKVDAEAMIAVNLGTRGIEDACNLLEYCNLDTDTYWANKRRENGHSEPYHVKFWCLGNEMDAPWQIGHKTAHEYGQLVNETAKAMRSLDPSIKIVVCGSSNEHTPTFGKWETTVLDECYDNVDYLSMHQYYELPSQGTMHHVAKAIRMDQFINSVVALCDAAKATKKSAKTLNISFDEWNVWYHSNEHDAHLKPWQQAPHQLEDVYNFEDALLVGSSLITLLKHADRVKIACFAQLVNVIAPILTTKEGVLKQTIFTPLRDVSQYAHGTALRTSAQSPTYQVPEFGDVPYLDAVTVKNDAHHYTIFAVNRHQTEALNLIVKLNDDRYQETSHLSYSCSDPEFKNSADQAVREENIQDAGQIILKPFSWNVITFTV
ncbi:arabinosylfuranosidase ArfA [Levilactobacillus fujinensis]|uniref:non-reducing end alpha-L-arabinofuranosidase n=1 Tax=Levilactobacillus fujinensis TaxID=2486024 RepID=A0ABW1THJ9_9LACO|nr:alpha-L-arabinofuranosidase C-terminal domain-containing protein [Levilactobacillus fujinensis]